MRRSLADFASAMHGRLVGVDAGFGAVSTDSRAIGRGELFVALSGPNFDGHDFVAAAAQRGAAAAVVARPLDVALTQIVVDDPLAALQRAAAAWRQVFDIPVVAVAGSNGKTTTKEMIATVLATRGPCHATRGTLNNHIGVPLTLLGLDAHHVSAVIEVGANHPGEVAALVALVKPTVGLVTNAGAEHLEGFGTLDGVARAEGEMFAGLSSDATAVLNADDPYASLWRTMSRAGRCVSFGTDATADCRAGGTVRTAGPAGLSQRFEIVMADGSIDVQIELAGRHNVLNALGAAAAAHAAGADLVQIRDGLGRMRAVRGRLEVKATSGGACLIDDSYNANPSSLSAGLEVLASLPGERWLVLGDMGELGEAASAAHLTAAVEARAAGVTRLYALGTLTRATVEAFGAGAESFADATELQLRLAAELHSGVSVLVKGSRSNRLERVVDFLVHTAGPSAPEGH
jgi:UDP-N-acetylmuramoyl-tripeptide--D-alanyl-D-alanine ligase